MIYVIEYWTDGAWHFARHADGQPMWFTTRAKADAALRKFPPSGSYRITQMRD